MLILLVTFWEKWLVVKKANPVVGEVCGGTEFGGSGKGATFLVRLTSFDDCCGRDFIFGGVVGLAVSMTVGD